MAQCAWRSNRFALLCCMLVDPGGRPLSADAMLRAVVPFPLPLRLQTRVKTAARCGCRGGAPPCATPRAAAEEHAACWYECVLCFRFCPVVVWLPTSSNRHVCNIGQLANSGTPSAGGGAGGKRHAHALVFCCRPGNLRSASPGRHGRSPCSELPQSPGSITLPIIDDHEYRLITLGNGLRALLVHDATAEKGAAACDVSVNAKPRWLRLPPGASKGQHSNAMRAAISVPRRPGGADWLVGWGGAPGGAPLCLAPTLVLRSPVARLPCLPLCMVSTLSLGGMAARAAAACPPQRAPHRSKVAACRHRLLSMPSSPHRPLLPSAPLTLPMPVLLNPWPPSTCPPLALGRLCP